MTTDQAANFLAYYGYLPSQSGTRLAIVDYIDIGSPRVCAAVGRFQASTGLEVTGQIDTATVELMTKPRCGCRDVDAARMVEFARWRKNRLTYHIASRIGNLAASEVDDIFHKAFSAWSKHADIIFTRVNSSDADIIISTGKGRGDGFDGPSGVLAWAETPNGNDGQLITKFDLSEMWTAILLLAVGTHEFGHICGLQHSALRTALMYAYANVDVFEPTERDDIPRIISLYGKAVDVPPPIHVQPGYVYLHDGAEIGKPTKVTFGTPYNKGVYLEVIHESSQEPT